MLDVEATSLSWVTGHHLCHKPALSQGGWVFQALSSLDPQPSPIGWGSFPEPGTALAVTLWGGAEGPSTAQQAFSLLLAGFFPLSLGLGAARTSLHCVCVSIGFWMMYC